VNAALSIHGMSLIPDDCRVLYQILTWRSLFSHAMEICSRMLWEVIPGVQEVFRQWRILTENIEGLDLPINS
jgi:hypothetical protein